MVSVESRRGRRIVGSIQLGAELRSALAAVCRAHDVTAGEVRASGALEGVELEGGRRIEGRVELVILHGSVVGGAIEARASLALRDGAMVGGRLARAVVASVDFVVESHEQLAPAIEHGEGIPTASAAPAATDVPLAARPAAVEDPIPPIVDDLPTMPIEIGIAPPVAAVERAAAASPAAPAVEPPSPGGADDRHEDVILSAGDIILHPRFQRCLVVKVESNHEYIQVQLRNGRLIRLSLEVLVLSPRGVENGQRIFHAAID